MELLELSFVRLATPTLSGMLSSLVYSIVFLLTVNSVFQEYYQTHQLKNTSPSTISWIGSIQIFFLFGGNLFGGPLFDRFGAKVSFPAELFLPSMYADDISSR